MWVIVELTSMMLTESLLQLPANPEISKSFQKTSLSFFFRIINDSSLARIVVVRKNII